MPRTPTLLLAAATAVLAPASAGAATLATDLPCYVERQAMTLTGAGWAPDSAFAVEGERIAASGFADPLGAWSATVAAPGTRGRSTRPRTQALTGLQDGAPVASTSVRTVDFAVDPQGPRAGAPTARRRVRFSGFQPGRRIYVHVRREGAKRVRTQRIGRAQSPCGTLARRLRRLPAVPAAAIRFGEYTIAFDSRRRYAQSTRPQFVSTTTLVRQPG